MGDEREMKTLIGIGILVLAVCCPVYGDSGIGKLYRELKSADEEVRSDACLLLGRVGNPEAVPYLKPLLGDRSILVRHCAAEAIAQIGGEAARQIFSELVLSDSVERRRVGSIGLGRIGAFGESFDALVRRLDDDNWEVRWSAVFGLGLAGDESIVPRLRKISREDPYRKKSGDYPVREAAERSIRKILDEVRWWQTYSDGRAASARDGKPMLVLFSVPESPWCRKMEDGPLVDPDVISLCRKWTCLRLDPRKETAVQERLSVGGVPTLILLDPQGEELDRLEGYHGSGDVANFIGSADTKGMTLKRMKDRHRKDPGDVRTSAELAEKLLERGDFAGAVPVLENILSADPKNRNGKEAYALFSLGYGLGRLGRHDEAVFQFEKLLAKYPSYPDNDKALYCLGLGRLALGRVPEAKKDFTKIVNGYKRSPLRKAAERILVEIEKKEAEKQRGREARK